MHFESELSCIYIERTAHSVHYFDTDFTIIGLSESIQENDTKNIVAIGFFLFRWCSLLRGSRIIIKPMKHFFLYVLFAVAVSNGKKALNDESEKNVVVCWIRCFCTESIIRLIHFLAQHICQPLISFIFD